MRIWFGLILKITVSERISKITERMKSFISSKTLFYKNTRFISKIITLFGINPQLIPSYSKSIPPMG